ncbi:MAG: hypothetical protein EZS28_034714 [Streblomastix strix]|uniref:Uncharacterized protein n=1 Tax=Streblomastix strix TaxID=222440 RepID=A0A5J4UIE4_9EUKA|nr:MAG: hypothetical protein EZS28_034714 [Streblomastix strix]
MIPKTTKKHYKQPKQQDRNSEIDSEDIETDPYHHTTRDPDMILPSEEENQENDQDQDVIQDQEITKAQEKLEWMLTGIKMDSKPEMNQEVEAKEHIGEGGPIIMKENRVMKIEINRIRKDTEKHRNIIHIQNKPLTRQRTQQIRTGLTNLRIRIEDKVGMITQMMTGQNAHRCRKTHLTTILTEIQHGQNMRPHNTRYQYRNLSNLYNKHKKCNRYRYNLNSKLQLKYRSIKGRIDQPPNQDDIDEQEIIQERLAIQQNEKDELGISDSDVQLQKLIGAIDNKNSLSPRAAQKQLQEIILQSVSNQTTKQQQQTIGSKIYQRIISPAPKMINIGMIKDKSVIQSQLSVTPTQKSQHRSGIRQRLKNAERELQELKAKQQLQQQNNIDLNNTNVEMPDIQGTVGQLTGLQPSSGDEDLGLNAGLRPIKTGSISVNNRERTELQINECHDDNADEEEDEQTDEAALNQNKDYRVNVHSQPLVQENLDIQPQNNQGSNALSLNGKR